jgi:hypothetical protein
MRWFVDYTDLHGCRRSTEAADERDAELLAAYLSRAGCDPVVYYDGGDRAILYGWGAVIGLVGALLLLLGWPT